MSYFRKLSFDDMLSMVKAAAAKRGVLDFKPDGNGLSDVMNREHQIRTSRVLPDSSVTVYGKAPKSINPSDFYKQKAEEGGKGF